MRFKERNDLANRCKEWIKDQIENNITIPFDPVHLVLAYLDVNGYLNEVVRCKDCKYYLHSNEKCELIDTRLHFYETDNTWAEDAFCAWGERRDDDEGDDQVPKTVR